jgi:hypothetical protein
MLLGSTKPETDRFLGKPVMARNIFGLTGEKAFKYRQGDFDVVVGFLNDLARYCASVRRRTRSERDREGLLRDRWVDAGPEGIRILLPSRPGRAASVARY